ncbi:MAG: protein kinase [Pirellulales bacterium]
MLVRCPHCRNPIELTEDGALTEVSCPTCGSSFSLIGTDSTASHQPAPSATLGRFTLVKQLGMGAFGTVWKSHDNELDRFVAIKIPRHAQLDSAEAAKFLREARTAAQLKHPNIVSVHEVGREGGTIYIVSDLVDGVTLTDWLTGQRPDPREAAALCAKLANALHHAHEHGVVHRDLKPGNIMLDRNNEPHIMDFGLAKREASEITVTMDGQILGTPAYMSPEQANGEGRHVNRRADIFSLGVILFELLTGERPFRGNARMLVHQLLTEDAPSP